MEKRIHVGIVQSYVNEALAHKSNDHEVYAELQHGPFPVVLRARFEGELTTNGLVAIL